MQLRLAEYKNGKFERFLELTDADLFVSPSGMIEFEKEGFLLGKDSILVLSMFDGFNSDYYNKDEKDPLNRFDGLFDGRTYGNGRFVLVVNDKDDILEIREQKKEIFNNKYKIISEKIVSDCFLGYRIKPDFLITSSSGKLIKTKFNGDQIWEESSKTSKIVGSLHENPEFYEEINKTTSYSKRPRPNKEDIGDI
jgi:hypothetical protein